MQHALWWEWDADKDRPRRLCEWGLAPETMGFYEIGFMRPIFEPMYGGRTSGLKQRLRRHCKDSHVEEIEKQASELWYRFKIFHTIEETKVVEGLYIAAFEYPWNKRREWTQWWAMDC